MPLRWSVGGSLVAVVNKESGLVADGMPACPLNLLVQEEDGGEEQQSNKPPHLNEGRVAVAEEEEIKVAEEDENSEPIVTRRMIHLTVRLNI